MNAKELRKLPFAQTLLNYVRHGDPDIRKQGHADNGLEIRASNAVSMTIASPAEGGYLDPSPLADEVVARRSEISLPEKLGCTLIPGKGSTLNVAVDDENDGEFVITAENATRDQDAPAIGQAAMTLKDYSKFITLSLELYEDADVRLLNFLINWIARAQAKTANQLLLAEVAASGTLFKTAASPTAIVAGELEATAINDFVEPYVDDMESAAWIMKPSTYSAIKSIQGNPRVYGGDRLSGQRSLLDYPVYLSGKAGAMTAGLKPVYFGAWRYVGYREMPFQILRDPYSVASTGQMRLWMNFRTVFKVLQPAAIGYLQMHT
jgi:HK97 family phage major capsid protein